LILKRVDARTAGIARTFLEKYPGISITHFYTLLKIAGSVIVLFVKNI
jgi:hypothetical protein